ncbi:MAG TPA: hypothetical protein VK014_04115 [Cyclobacteriaceae bacterium]|nr:hypothetical protein [Cyclobacteriaceae bacterium]
MFIKQFILFFLLLPTIWVLGGNVVLTTEVRAVEKEQAENRNGNGVLPHKISLQSIGQIKERGYARYSDFGAKGDGKHDDMEAIAKTHAFANQENLPVKADDNATYYIGGKAMSAIIQTNTDFGKARFIIDDRKVEDRTADIFVVKSHLKPFKPEGIISLRRNQAKISLSLPGPSLITVTDSTVRRYIRFGPNQNNGSPQTDIVIVDQSGKIDPATPLIWDFDQITDISALPMDQEKLAIRGGKFTTIANQAASKYTYYGRGIAIMRSNVVVDGLEHYVTGEKEHGAPYSGFLAFRDCANVTVRNSILTGRKTYRTIGSAGVPVSMGSYDISITRALNVTFENCSQTNDINDEQYWGIMGSNFSKNLVLNHCRFSRFDAHMGVANATIRNSELGHMGVNAIGSGTFTIENTTLYGRNLINLRPDYGSTWEGTFVIRNCIFVPAAGRPFRASLFGGSNHGQHDFGYPTYMPEKIIIDGLTIVDTNHPEEYEGPSIFANFNPHMTDDTYQEKFPHYRPKEVILRNIKIESGKVLRTSDNPYQFKDIKIIKED